MSSVEYSSISLQIPISQVRPIGGESAIECCFAYNVKELIPKVYAAAYNVNSAPHYAVVTYLYIAHVPAYNVNLLLRIT